MVVRHGVYVGVLRPRARLRHEALEGLQHEAGGVPLVAEPVRRVLTVEVGVDLLVQQAEVLGVVHVQLQVPDGDALRLALPPGRDTVTSDSAASRMARATVTAMRAALEAALKVRNPLCVRDARRDSEYSTRRVQSMRPSAG